MSFLGEGGCETWDPFTPTCLNFGMSYSQSVHTRRRSQWGLLEVLPKRRRHFVASHLHMPIIYTCAHSREHIFSYEHIIIFDAQSSLVFDTRATEIRISEKSVWKNLMALARPRLDRLDSSLGADLAASLGLTRTVTFVSDQSQQIIIQ